MIRHLKFADASAIYRVLECARAASPVPIGPKWSENQIAEECRGEGFVFEREGEVSSFILFRDAGDAWEITFLATTPDAQGQGLMKALIEYMRERRPQERPIWLEVHSSNVKARRLYEQQGFEVVGERPKYYSDGGSAILYTYGVRAD